MPNVAWSLLLCLAMLVGACTPGSKSPSAERAEANFAVARKDAAALTTKPDSLPDPDHLPLTVRRMLRVQMQRHSEHSAALQAAVLRLDFAAAERAATALHEEPTLARPDTDDATLLNARLPEPFLSLQDDLNRQAEIVAQTARSGDATALAREYGTLSATCVQCHAIYLLPEAHDTWQRSPPRP